MTRCCAACGVGRPEPVGPCPACGGLQTLMMSGHTQEAVVEAYQRRLKKAWDAEGIERPRTPEENKTDLILLFGEELL